MTTIVLTFNVTCVYGTNEIDVRMLCVPRVGETLEIDLDNDSGDKATPADSWRNNKWRVDTVCHCINEYGTDGNPYHTITCYLSKA